MKGSVLEQLYNGQKISAGASIEWGSKISLVIAGGLNDEKIGVPDLIGKTYAEGKAILESSGINIGAVVGKDVIKDTASSFIFKQSPDKFDDAKRPVYIHPGQLMDIYISQIMILPDSTLTTKQPTPLK